MSLATSEVTYDGYGCGEMFSVLFLRSSLDFFRAVGEGAVGPLSSLVWLSSGWGRTCWSTSDVYSGVKYLSRNWKPKFSPSLVRRRFDRLGAPPTSAGSLKIQHRCRSKWFNPMGFYYKLKTGECDNAAMVIYVYGGWLSGFIFKVTSTRFEAKVDASSSLNLYLHFPRVFCRHNSAHFRWAWEVPMGTFLLAALRYILADPSQIFTAWQGHFSLE